MNLDLNRVKLVPEIIRDLKLESKLFSQTSIKDDRYFENTLKFYKSFDILTYSISPAYIFKDRPIHRLIYAIGTPPRKTQAAVQVSGSHAKLWICYTPTFTDVYIGSGNATEMTLHELMFKVNADAAELLKRHFNRLWELNYKKK